MTCTLTHMGIGIGLQWALTKCGEVHLKMELEIPQFDSTTSCTTARMGSAWSPLEEWEAEESPQGECPGLKLTSRFSGSRYK